MRAAVITFKRARRLRREMTLPEVLLWQALRNHALADERFRRQHPCGPYSLDFFCAAAKLAVEIDGAVHDDPARFAKDRSRDRFLDEQRIRVIRFNARDVLDVRARQDVLDTINAAVRGRISP